MTANVSDARQKAGFDEACRFVESLADASQSYGISSRNMVTALTRVVTALGLRGEFLATPNFVQTVLWGEDDSQRRVHISGIRSGNFNLTKLTRMTDLAKHVEAGSVGPAEGLAKLREIMSAGDQYGPLMTALGFIFSGAAFAVIMGGAWMDVLFGGAIALASFGVTLLAARSAGVAVLQEFLVAMIAALLASAAARIIPGANPVAVTICAVIWFVPGFGLTIAPSEMMSGGTLSGIIWLTNALVAAVKLLSGAAIGLALAKGAGFGAASVSPGGQIPPVWDWVAVPTLIIALAVLMRADPRSFGAILVGGWLVWGLIRIGTPFGFWQGTFLAATALMIYANWYARRFSRPSAAILLPCVMVLVPGLPALKALHAMRTEGFLAGIEAGSDVALIVAAIVGGALLGQALALNKIVETSKAMRSLVMKPRGAKGRGGSA